MSRILPQPFKHPKTGVYYFRKVIPARIRPAFNGRTELRKSLGTKDWRQAKLLQALAVADAERLLASALASPVVGEPVPLSATPPAVSNRVPRPKQTSRKVRAGDSFEYLVDRWIAEAKPLPKSGYSKRRMAQALAAFVGHDRPSDLSKRDVLNWKDAMISQGLHHKTINSRLSALQGQLAPQPLEQAEDLSLDRDVERGGDFVGNEDLRLQGERTRDADPLALTPGELCGAPVEQVAGKFDLGH